MNLTSRSYNWLQWSTTESVLPKNRIELDVRSRKSTSATCSFVIFQSLNALSVSGFSVQNPYWTLEITLPVYINPATSTFRTRLEPKLQTSLWNISQITSLNFCLIFCALWSILKSFIFASPLYNPVKRFINTFLDVKCKPYPPQVADKDTEILPNMTSCPRLQTHEVVEPEPGCGPWLCFSFCRTLDPIKGAIPAVRYRMCPTWISAIETS